ncbi:MAG TPA: hypothetical protein HPP77_06160 [Candidatus Hydrogenedentes bacterium]|nr:hypothetical protein [Candidatus Hydrogenedentota bacterium]HIJ72815.1 hypothetical protein [Candidatus Hydrogenedentota bacterium]
MAIIEGLGLFARETLGQVFTIPLENPLSYLYTILNLFLQILGFTLSAGE